MSFLLFFFNVKMPLGNGTYGTKVQAAGDTK